MRTHRHTPLAALLLAACTLTACKHHDEIDFSGQIIGTRRCLTSFIDTQAGYLVRIDRPADIGVTLHTSEGDIKNVVILYEPTCRVYVDDEVEGSFYFDDNYSKSNCGTTPDSLTKGLPEGVFTDLSVK